MHIPVTQTVIVPTSTHPSTASAHTSGLAATRTHRAIALRRRRATKNECKSPSEKDRVHTCVGNSLAGDHD